LAGLEDAGIFMRAICLHPCPDRFFDLLLAGSVLAYNAASWRCVRMKFRTISGGENLRFTSSSSRRPSIADFQFARNLRQFGGIGVAGDRGRGFGPVFGYRFIAAPGTAGQHQMGFTSPPDTTVSIYPPRLVGLPDGMRIDEGTVLIGPMKCRGRVGTGVPIPGQSCGA